MKIVVCVDEVYEDLELWYPVIRLREAGIEVVIAGPEKKEYAGKHGYPCTPDMTFAQMGTSWDGILIPGGFAPDKLRRNEEVCKLVKRLNDEGKVIAFICHGGWVPISAGIVKGRRVTGTVAIKDDFENAGAVFVDEAVVVDGNLISSRTPKDLHLFAKGIVDLLHA